MNAKSKSKKKIQSVTEIPAGKLTPMLRQYLRAKESCPDSILMFRMGDFFEMFFEDAVEAAPVLDITLTSREAGGAGRVPMCGVPHRAVDSYIARLIRAGKTVSICDQVEDPKLAKKLVRREVVRTVTAGTVVDPHLLDSAASNYLCTIAPGDGRTGLAFVDMSTGEFVAAELSEADDGADGLRNEIARMRPAECLLSDDLGADHPARRLADEFPDIQFRARGSEDTGLAEARRRLTEHYRVQSLRGFGLEDMPLATVAAGMALDYLEETQRATLPHLRHVRAYSPGHYVTIDANTQRTLELVETRANRKKRGSLLGVLDKTLTAPGARMLRRWIVRPLRDVASIRLRLDAIEELIEAPQMLIRLREAVRGLPDAERLLSRLGCRTGTARDLRAMVTVLACVPALRQLLDGCSSAMLGEARELLDDMPELRSLIDRAVVDEPPAVVTDGGMIREGYDEELDRLKELVQGGKGWIAKLQRDEIERTGIASLKVGYNKVFGYYIEVSKANAQLVPEDYIRKQTLVNAERYVTPELKEREEEIVTAQERMVELERRLFEELRDKVCAASQPIMATAEAAATCDVLAALATVAGEKNYCKPAVTDGYDVRIVNGRHPVLEDVMPAGSFVPNDTSFEQHEHEMLIITGPNMAGKSTYLRQVALIALMAQMGSYVPADAAEIGVVDQLFTRAGAADDIVHSQSTFMVEMNETAHILNCATERSLVVLDEIGRGTSTFDGISIAWGVAEYLTNSVGCKTLFATHYHELTELSRTLETSRNLNVAVREWEDKVVFLYRIVAGAADHSYGIQVARLAGLPQDVIDRSRRILESLEQEGEHLRQAARAGRKGPRAVQMLLFGDPQPSSVETELKKLDPDILSPKEAQDAIYRLKKLLDSEQK